MPRRRPWDGLFDELVQSPGGNFGQKDLERLATAAWLIGRDSARAELWVRADHDLQDGATSHG